MHVIMSANAGLDFVARTESWKAAASVDFPLYSSERGSSCPVVHRGLLRGYGFMQVQQKENVLSYRWQ